MANPLRPVARGHIAAAILGTALGGYSPFMRENRPTTLSARQSTADRVAQIDAANAKRARKMAKRAKEATR